MNWKRGLLRLWAVAAVLWVGVAFYSGDTWQHVAGERIIDLSDPDGTRYELQLPAFIDEKAAVEDAKTEIIKQKPNLSLLGRWRVNSPSIWPPLFDFAKLAFIPPLFLLALGYIGLWVGRGFRR
jgi:hypothetical protein